MCRILGKLSMQQLTMAKLRGHLSKVRDYSPLRSPCGYRTDKFSLVAQALTRFRLHCILSYSALLTLGIFPRTSE